jgi:hypothetical protein
MSYRKYLTRYGSPSDTAEIRCNIYLVDPAKIAEHKDIIWRDKITAEDITRLENILEALKDYRKDLAKRYGELETMPYKRLLMLDRCVHWKGHKEYIVTITRICEDKTRIQELREVYPGKERHKSLARYHELQKKYPGIESEMDITKQKWER